MRAAMTSFSLLALAAFATFPPLPNTALIYLSISEKDSKPEIKVPTKGVSPAHRALFLAGDLHPGQDNRTATVQSPVNGVGTVWGLLPRSSRASAYGTILSCRFETLVIFGSRLRAVLCGLCHTLHMALRGMHMVTCSVSLCAA